MLLGNGPQICLKQRYGPLGTARRGHVAGRVMTKDVAQDVTQDGRWMSYGELARARGIDRQSAVKLVRRQGWRRQLGNHGEVRVYVPIDGLTRAMTRDETPDESRVEARLMTRDITAFETALAAIEAAHATEIAALRELVAAAELSRVAAQDIANELRNQLAQIGERAVQAEARADAAVTRAEVADADRRSAEQRAGAERSRAEQLDQKLRAEQSRASKAEQAADQFRTAAQEALQAAETADSDRRAAEIARDQERARSDGLKGLLEATQLELAEQRALTDQADAARQEAVGAAEELRRIESARKARGLMARLRAAWRGE